MSWEINLWSRMHDGDYAYAMIRNLCKFIGTSETSMRGSGLY